MDHEDEGWEKSRAPQCLSVLVFYVSAGAADGHSTSSCMLVTAEADLSLESLGIEFHLNKIFYI